MANQSNLLYIIFRLASNIGDSLEAYVHERRLVTLLTSHQAACKILLNHLHISSCSSAIQTGSAVFSRSGSEPSHPGFPSPEPDTEHILGSGCPLNFCTPKFEHRVLQCRCTTQIQARRRIPMDWRIDVCAPNIISNHNLAMAFKLLFNLMPGL